jgi:hypothetical protein
MPKVTIPIFPHNKLPDDFRNLPVHNMQSLKNLLRPTLADHLTWHPPMLVDGTQKDKS